MSLLDALAARKAELQAQQVTTIPVPLWDNPTIRVRVKCVDHERLSRIMLRMQKAKGGALSKATLNAHAAIVEAATVAVILGGDGDAELELSSPDLVSALELPEGSTPIDVVRALCLREADVIALSDAVFKHSGYAQDDIEDDFAGE